MKIIQLIYFPWKNKNKTPNRKINEKIIDR